MAGIRLRCGWDKRGVDDNIAPSQAIKSFPSLMAGLGHGLPVAAPAAMRWRLVNEGKNIEVHITVDDPDTYNQPWQATRQFRRVQVTLQEEACAENNLNFGLFDYHIPEAKTPDF